MRKIEIEEFIPEVAVEVHSAPFPTIEEAIRKTIIRFCRDTLAWREQLSPVYCAEGTTDALVLLPRETQIHMLLKVERDGNPFEDFEFEMPDTLILSNEPSEAFDLEIKAALAPSFDARTVPRIFYDRHRNVIAHGARSELMAMSASAWANPSMSQHYWSLYKRAVAREKIGRVKGYTNKSLRVKSRRFV